MVESRPGLRRRVSAGARVEKPTRTAASVVGDRSVTKRKRRASKSAPPNSADERPHARTRRSAEEARQRILDAAEKLLMKVGPEGLRLTDLAKMLRVSHPAILHHFGSREGLVAAVVHHSMLALSAQLLAALRAGNAAADRDQLMELVADVCDQRGLARLLAWLMLSDRAGKIPRSTEPPLRQLAEAAYGLRRAQTDQARYEDVLFEVQLIATVLLGDAIFGPVLRVASGMEPTPRAARAFRERLAQLLAGPATRDA